MEITATTNISEQRIRDLLCSAFEGGSNYWYLITKYNYPKGQTQKTLGIEFPHLELPFKGGSITIKDTIDKKSYELNLATIQKGLKLMVEKYPKHYSDFIHEDDDADTGDVFLQLCLLDDVIYG
jgi:hypothetical protein